jgi:hypothetical protein
MAAFTNPENSTTLTDATRSGASQSAWNDLSTPLPPAVELIEF